jgi:anti-sigma-K factor RskA
LISSTDKDAAVILARGLPTLKGGKVYQVWVITGESPTSQGVFQTGGAMLMKGVTKVDSVAVTIEPEGGSKKPTTEPIAVIPV